MNRTKAASERMVMTREELLGHPLYTLLCEQHGRWLLSPRRVQFLLSLALACATAAIVLIWNWQPALLLYPICAIIVGYYPKRIFMRLLDKGILRDLHLTGLSPLHSVAAIREALASRWILLADVPIYFLLCKFFLKHINTYSLTFSAIMVLAIMLVRRLMLPSRKLVQIGAREAGWIAGTAINRSVVMWEMMPLVPLVVLLSALYYRFPEFAAWAIILPIVYLISYKRPRVATERESLWRADVGQLERMLEEVILERKESAGC